MHEQPSVEMRAGLGRVRAVARAAAVAMLAGCQGAGAGPGADPAADDPAGPEPATVMEIQGEAHLSPLMDRRVVTTGIVTLAVDGGFHLQARPGDGRPETSDALFVTPDDGTAPTEGDSVRVAGTVRERVPGGRSTGNLSVTRIEASSVELLARKRPLPEPVVLGTEGRVPPGARVIGPGELPVDLRDPGQVAFNPFDPATDGIDFYESLEGMRVVVAAPVAVSPTATFGDGATGEVFTLVERGAHAVPDDARTAAGGILLQPHPDNRGDQNPERVQVQFDAGVYPDAVPELAVGDRLGDVSGVVGYRFGNYEVLATEAVEVNSEGGAPSGEPPAARAATELVGTADGVTVATYNVGGMNPLPETDARRTRVGEHIAGRLGAPDVVALQEIQDENGTRGGAADPTTDATATLAALVEAVVDAGGPRYAFVDVAPEQGASGGAPGANIRNAFLYDSTRVELVEARSPGPAELRDAGARDPDAFDGIRDPLVGVFSFDGRRFTVVNVHLTSRAGSTPVFGAVQPFVQAGEGAREAQLRSLHDHVSSLLAEEPDVGVVVLGDMNTFEFTDDLTGILPGRGDGAILWNLLQDVPSAERYTFNFEGNSQALDHVFVTESLWEGARADVVHLNADVPESGRASDHDAVVAWIRVR